MLRPRRRRSLLFLAGLAFLSWACVRRPRLNPLDPQNAPGQGLPSGPAATPTATATDLYENDNNYISAAPLTLGQDQHRSLEPGNDQDWAVFTLGSLSDVRIETLGLVGDTYLEIFDGSSAPVSAFASDDNSGVGLFSSLSLILAPGTYYVRVTSVPSAPVQAYTLSLSLTNVSPTATPTFTATATATTAPQLIDNFEDGNLTSLQAQPWTTWDDGGGSSVVLGISAPGVASSAGCLQVDFNVATTIDFGGIYGGYCGNFVDVTGTAPPAIQHLSFWTRGTWFPAHSSEPLYVWVSMTSGNSYTASLTGPNSGATWNQLVLDMNSDFVPDGAWTWAGELGQVQSVWFYAFFIDSLGTSDSAQIFLDDICFGP